eukprot:s1638_g1.t1
MPPGTSFQLLYWLNWLVLLPGPSSALLRRHSAAVLSDPSLETCSPLVNHESFSSVEVRLGTPAQKLNLVADTGSNNVVVMSCACLLTKSCPESFGTCFRGENVSSTFVLRNASASVLGSASRESSGRGSAPESLLIEFGSGRIGAFVASDVVHVGSVRTFLEDSLLLMVKQKLSVPGPFEGILGLGQPPQGEAAAKKQVVSGFLEQANIQRFSMCFNYEGDGVLGLHVNQSPSLWLRSLGQLHWGLELQGVSVGSGQISFCAPKHKQPGQRTACGMIPDSGTTLINGPREQVLQLYEEICRSWPRCMEAQVALEQELGNLTAENQTLTGVSLLQHGVPGLGTKAIIAKVLHILAGTFAASRMSNGTSAANRTQAVQRGSRRLFALDLQRNETPRRAGEATTGRQALSIQPSDTFQLLLRHCAEWIEQVNVDDELPELSFHVAGAEAAEQMLTLRPASYVLQANMDVASPHVQNILGFLPMEVFQTRPLGTRLGRAVVCWVKQATPARLRQALRWAERPPAPGGRVYCPVPGCPCADPARAPGWLNVTTMSMLTFQVRYRDRPAARATAAEDSRPAREGTCPRWLTSSRVARGRLRHVPAAARYLWGRVLAQAVAAAVHCNEGAPPRGGRRHRRTASNAGWRESAERYGIDRGQPPRYAPRALDDEQKRSLATALTREGFDRNALLATGLCPDNHDRVAALRALHPAQAMPAVDIDGVAEAAWWRSPGRPSRTSLAWRDGWAGLTGDPLGPLLFSAVLQSLAAELRALPLDLAFFYLDDDVLADVQGGCSCSATCQRNLSKCEVVGAGLLSASALTTSVLPQSLVCASDGSSWFQRNFELLGAAIGDEDFTAAHCLTRAKAAAPHKGAIGGLEDTQVSLRLLRSCAPRALHYFDSLECFAGFTGLRLAAVQLEQASRSVYGSDAAAYLASAGGSYQACCELDASYGIAPLSSDPYVVQALAAFNDFLPQPLAVETVLASKQKMLTRLLAMRPAGRSTLLPRL